MANLPSQMGNELRGIGGVRSYAIHSNSTDEQGKLISLFSAMYQWDWLDSDKTGKMLECIISLHAIPRLVSHSGAYPVYIGSQSFLTGTSEGLPLLTNRFSLFKEGHIDIPHKYSNYLDYPPYSRLVLHLPFIGDREIDPSPFIGSALKIAWQIDCYTGDVICYICDTSWNVYHSFTGNCAIKFPLSGADYSRNTSGMIQALTGALTIVGGVVAENPLMVAGGAIGATVGLTSAFKTPQTMLNGSITGCAAYMGILDSYASFTYPVFDADDSIQAYKVKGKPCHKYTALSGLTGFTKIAEINLKDFTGQQNEYNECVALLKEGVIL